MAVHRGQHALASAMVVRAALWRCAMKLCDSFYIGRALNRAGFGCVLREFFIFVCRPPNNYKNSAQQPAHTTKRTLSWKFRFGVHIVC